MQMLTMNFKIGQLFLLKLVILFQSTVILFGCPSSVLLIAIHKKHIPKALRAGKGKKVIITETGWPSEGSNLAGAVPSEENAMKYFINAQNWSKEEDIDIFYFSSFDESWKVDSEGDVGSYWGVWDKDEQLKFQK